MLVRFPLAQCLQQCFPSIAPGFKGYLIAECNFYPARGLGITMRLGGSDPAMYVAEVLHTQPPKKSFSEQRELVESVVCT